MNKALFPCIIHVENKFIGLGRSAMFPISEEGTDFGECAAGFITITPLQVDLTAYGQMEQTASFWSEIPAP